MYTANHIFIAFRSVDIKATPIGKFCADPAYPDANCAKYGTDKDKTIAYCATECMKLKVLFLADKATGANCNSFVMQRNKANRGTWSCNLRTESPLQATHVRWGSDAVIGDRTGVTDEKVYDTYVLGNALSTPDASGSYDSIFNEIPIHPVATTHAIQNYVERANGFVYGNAGENKFTCTLNSW